MNTSSPFQPLDVRLEVRGVEVDVWTHMSAPSTVERIEQVSAVVVSCGPFVMSFSAEEAVALGDALIQSAHHFRAQCHRHFEQAGNAEGAAA